MHGLNLEIPAESSLSNGGLGGLKDVSALPTDVMSDGEGTTPLPWHRRKRNQSSLSVSEQSQSVETPRPLISRYHPSLENTASPRSPHFFRSPRTPQTPKSPAPPKHVSIVQSSPMLTPHKDSPGFSRVPSPLAKSEQFASLDRRSPELALAIGRPKVKSFAIELPGSLLLASQGFPQTFPPTLPPRPENASRSSSGNSYDSSSSSSDSSETSGAEDSSDTTASEMSSRAAMPKFPTPPPRNHQPSSPITASRSSPPPMPLSKMSLEELMRILPTLDAAIIANDWAPCVVRKHDELKNTMQSFSEASYEKQKQIGKVRRENVAEGVDPNVSQTIQSEFDRVNSTIPAAEKVLSGLQDVVKKDPNNTTNDLEFARSQARIARARTEQLQAQMMECTEQHNREVQELRTLMRKTVGILGDFIEENLQITIDGGDISNIEEVLQIIANNSDGTKDASHEVPLEMLRETQASYKQMKQALEEARNCAYEQQNRLSCKDRELDEYAKRFAEVRDKLQKAIDDANKLRRENHGLYEQLRIQKTVTASQQLQANITQPNRQDSGSNSTISAYNQTVQDQVKILETENDLLRTKLSESRASEQKMQLQQRDLIQQNQAESSQAEPPQRGRFRRILTGDKDIRTLASIKASSSMFSLSGSSNSGNNASPPIPKKDRKQSPSRRGRSLSATREHIGHGRFYSSDVAAGGSNTNIAGNLQRRPPVTSRTYPVVETSLKKFEQFMVKRKETYSDKDNSQSSASSSPTKAHIHRFAHFSMNHRPATSGRPSISEPRPIHSEHETAPAPEVYVPPTYQPGPLFVPQITASPPPAEPEKQSRCASLNAASEIVHTEIFLPRKSYSPRNTPSPRPEKEQYQRVLSGITEVSEANTGTGTLDKRVIHEAPCTESHKILSKSLSPSVTAADEEMYRETMRSLKKLEGWI